MARRLNHINERIAANLATRQVEALAKADAVAAASEAVVRQVAARIDALVSVGAGSPVAHLYLHRSIHALLASVPGLLIAQLERSLSALALWGHDSAVRALVGSLPDDYLLAASVLIEDDRFPGSVSVNVPEPTGRRISKKEYADLLFDPPSADKIEEIIKRPVGGENWEDRIRGLTRKAPPDRIAREIADGVAVGKTRVEIMADLQPILGGSASAARRVARTEGLRVAEQMQMDAWDQAGGLIAGFQIHATLDERTRPHHAARNGLIWMKASGEDMAAALKMEAPTLPDEANCRCWLSPVLDPPKEILNDPALMAEFENEQKQVVPDPAVYSDWFANASEDKQRKAVGSRRYSAVRDRLGRAPAWEDFINPDTGKLLAVEDLKNEKESARQERLTKTRSLIADRAELIRQTDTYGFALPREPLSAVPGTVAPTGPIQNAADLAMRMDAHRDDLESVRQTVAAEGPRSAKRTEKAEERIRSRMGKMEKLFQSGDEKSQKQMDVLAEYIRKDAESISKKKEIARLSALQLIMPKRKALLPTRTGAPREAKEAAEFVSSILSSKEKLTPFGSQVTRTGKAYYDRRTQTIHTPPGSNVETFVHELGHHIEAIMPEVFDAVHAFIEKRIGGERPQELRLLFPGPVFGAGEMGRKDRFDLFFSKTDAYYVGKVYNDGSTEIVSMGLKALHDDPIGFAQKDPDYFRFMIGILNGRLR